MPFFPKSCFGLRKKKKGVKKNESLYFKSYTDNVSSLTSEATQPSTSNSLASIGRDGIVSGCSSKPKLEVLERITENPEEKETEDSEKDGNAVYALFTDKDILDVLDIVMEQFSDERSESEDNRYRILSSSSAFDEESEELPSRRLLSEPNDAFETKLNVDSKQTTSSSSREEKIEDFVVASVQKHDLKSNEFNETSTDVVKIKSNEEYIPNIIDLVSSQHLRHKVVSHTTITIVNFSPSNLKNGDINPVSRRENEINDVVDGILESAEEIENESENVLSDQVDQESETEDNSESEISSLNVIDEEDDESYQKLHASSYQLFDLQLIEAVKHSVGIASEGSKPKSDEIGYFSGDNSPNESEESSFVAFNQEEVNEKQANFLNEIGVGDNIPELVQKIDALMTLLPDSSADIMTKMDDLVTKTTANDPEAILEHTLATVSECSCDHADYVTENSEKEITCRMAAVIEQGQNLNPTFDSLNSIQGMKPNSKRRSILSKRRRSRNVLLNSLNIKLSPEEKKYGLGSTKQAQGQSYTERKECMKQSVNINQLSGFSKEVANIKSHDNKRHEMVGCPIEVKNDSSTEEEHTLKKHGSGIFKHVPTISNATKMEDFEIATDINLDAFKSHSQKYSSSDDSPERALAQNCLDSSLGTTSDAHLQAQTETSTELGEAVEVQISKIIKKATIIVQREINHFSQLDPEDVNSFIRLMKELLFDYSFNQNWEDEALVGNEMQSENCGTVYQKLDSMQANCDNSESTEELGGLFRKFTINDSAIDQDDDEQSASDRDDTIGLTCQTLDEYLTHLERLKYESKIKISRGNLKQENGNIETEELHETTSSEFVNENVMCYQMTCGLTDNKGSFINKSQCFSLEETGSFTGEDQDVPSMSSDMVDVGNKGIFAKSPLSKTRSPCGDRKLLLDLDIEKSVLKPISPSNFTRKSPSPSPNSRAEQSSAIKQNSKNKFTIILSPRREDATIKCSPNMSVLNDDAKKITNLCSPIAIQVTRIQANTKARRSSRMRDVGSKSTVEDVLEMCRRRKIRSYDVKRVEGERLRHLEAYNRNKSEALKPMKHETRIIPIHSSDSFEFTLSPLKHTKRNSHKPSDKFKKSRQPDFHVFLSPKQIREAALGCPSSSSTCVDLPLKRTPIRDRLLRNGGNYMFSPASPIYRTPVRRRILTASKAIRSPKHPFKIAQSPSKLLSQNAASARKIIVNHPKLYFVEGSASGNRRNGNGRLRSSKRGKNLEDYEVMLESPSRNNEHHMAPTNLPSPEELRTKFDDKFRRYAKRGRNSGGLISYRGSTEWLRDAGIIGPVLTAEEADNTFKSVAGVKIALNKCDYIRFLFKLCRLKRLSYNEVYERLCDADDELA